MSTPDARRWDRAARERVYCRAVIAVLAVLCIGGRARAQSTQVTLTGRVLHSDVQRFGINLSGQTYYDSGQMLRNLVYRNPGFEGEMWQSILHCKTFSATTCADTNEWTVWPRDFLAGGTYRVLTGSAAGQTGSILSQSAAASHAGVQLRLSPFAGSPHDGDFLLVRAQKPGGAEAGWWPDLSGGATLATEFHDLSAATPGKQALRMIAEQAGQRAAISSYFDTLEGHSFLHLSGVYSLDFRARPVSGSRTLHLRVQRLDKATGAAVFLDQSKDLAPGWHDYHLTFRADDRAGATGSVGLTFAVTGATVLLDDVSLTPAAHPGNATVFRDEVVAALRDLHPGVLRSMDNGTGFGSSLDNLLAPEFARERAGASTQATKVEDVPIGLGDFLALCEAVHADPWITLPPGLDRAEMLSLMEYLGGPSTSGCGRRRAAAGQQQPWTSVFHTIHLELGNEQWNAPSFAGSTIADPDAYGAHAATLFRAARGSAYFSAGKYDLVAGTWFAVPWWTLQEQKALAGAADSLAIAPYLFSEYTEARGPDAVFSAMLAQPEQFDSRPDGLVMQQSRAADAGPHPAKLAVYETNLGTATGSAAITQAALDLTVPSMGAGLAVADHLLLMLRDAGVTAACVFALPEFENRFTSTPGTPRMTPLWGTVVDMGGATNRKRPVYLALQMLNRAVLPQMLEAAFSGDDPRWDETSGVNDHITLQSAHELQTFAFAGNGQRSLIALNLDRNHAHTITLAGPDAPAGAVEVITLTASKITDSNEQSELVKPVTRTVRGFSAASAQELPPFSLTTYVWQTRPETPARAAAGKTR